jgi:N-methylhydantoinase A
MTFSGSSASPAHRLGIDIGGTFTDLVLAGSDGSLVTRKVPSTPDNYSRGIVDGVQLLLDHAGIAPDAITEVVHATTVAANTILEGKGARTALVTTRGFRDVLEMRRLRIPELYNLSYRKPPPLVPRRNRFEVDERVGPLGEVRRPLDEDEVRVVADVLRSREIEAIAICFIHAYANASHERRTAEILRSELGPDVYISYSADVLPEIREYERTSTVVVNAHVGPVVERYLGSLVEELANVGVHAPLRVMQSGGGVTTAAGAIRKPAHIIESGPAAGVMACARLAREAGYENVISLDMGGTTAKAALIENGEPVKTAEYEVGAGINISSRLIKGGGYAIKLPFIDVSEIGAGGGSVIAVDEFDRLTVGPRSAGADPGPVCYGRGGTEPTLTDALLALGHLNPRYLAGGELPIDRERAEKALQDLVARRLGMTVCEAALGVLALSVATMTRAVKAVSTYRGRDPRDFALVAFGGNGPVVGAAIAEALEMDRVIAPTSPGVFSALGLLFSTSEYDFAKTVTGDGHRGAVAEAYEALELEATQTMVREGHEIGAIEITRFADMRYVGQAYELTVGVPSGRPEPELLAQSFADEHRRTYGHAADDPVQLVNVRIVARAKSNDRAAHNPGIPGPAANGDGPAKVREVVFDGHGARTTPIVGRHALDTGMDGPLIVEEYDSTCVVPPGWRARLDELGNIELRRAAR